MSTAVPLYSCSCGRKLGLLNLKAGDEFVCPVCGAHNEVPQKESDTTRILEVPGGVRPEDATCVLVDGAPELSAEVSSFHKVKGERLGPFEVLRKIGSGGMGTVYEAWDAALQRSVAVKVLPANLARDAGSVERFRREAHAAASLSHPNIVHVYTIGEENGRWFFAMEHVVGCSVAQMIDRDGPFSLEKAVRILREVVAGLGLAAKKGITHRDIKPSNIMVGDDGFTRVTDFGLAKLAHSDSSLTGTGTAVGTPYYMSPEQGKGETVDHRSDIYSLGATFYHMLFGRPPYRGDTPLQVMLQHATGEMEIPKDSPWAKREDVLRLLQRMLAKDPAQRPATYEELDKELEGILPRPLVYAGLFPRAIAGVVDLLAATAMAIPVVLFPAAVVLHVIFAKPEADFLFVRGSNILIMASVLFYYWLVEGRAGQSLGKRLVNLRVLSRDGTPVPRGRITVRAFAATLWIFGQVPAWAGILPGPVRISLAGLAILSFLGCLWIPLDKRKQALHDQLFETVVVYRV